MNVSKIVINNTHHKWCQDFLNEQNKTTKLVRKVLRKASMYNPFAYDKNIDNILKRYEKSFWD